MGSGQACVRLSELGAGCRGTCLGLAWGVAEEQAPPDGGSGELGSGRCGDLARVVADPRPPGHLRRQPGPREWPGRSGSRHRSLNATTHRAPGVRDRRLRLYQPLAQAHGVQRTEHPVPARAVGALRSPRDHLHIKQKSASVRSEHLSFESSGTDCGWSTATDPGRPKALPLSRSVTRRDTDRHQSRCAIRGLGTDS